jgi:hypothetical protein
VGSAKPFKGFAFFSLWWLLSRLANRAPTSPTPPKSDARAYFRSHEGERQFNPGSTTAWYNRLVTQRPFGPDGLPVNAGPCRADRGCFKPESGPDRVFTGRSPHLDIVGSAKPFKGFAFFSLTVAAFALSRIARLPAQPRGNQERDCKQRIGLDMRLP